MLSKTARWTKILMTILTFSDNLLQDIFVVFEKVLMGTKHAQFWGAVHGHAQSGWPPEFCQQAHYHYGHFHACFHFFPIQIFYFWCKSFLIPVIRVDLPEVVKIVGKVFLIAKCWCLRSAVEHWTHNSRYVPAQHLKQGSLLYFASLHLDVKGYQLRLGRWQAWFLEVRPITREKDIGTSGCTGKCPHPICRC